jgi:hypothetical protein
MVSAGTPPAEGHELDQINPFYMFGLAALLGTLTGHLSSSSKDWRALGFNMASGLGTGLFLSPVVARRGSLPPGNAGPEEWSTVWAAAFVGGLIGAAVCSGLVRFAASHPQWGWARLLSQTLSFLASPPAGQPPPATPPVVPPAGGRDD